MKAFTIDNKRKVALTREGDLGPHTDFDCNESYAAPGELLRMSGALGPLQASGLAGSFTW
jgi:hypothetical protein